ncbi:MAG TPA: M1 family aminopeptidase [Longimicrobiaceae bacterium]|nr:M1 family aminopeptidase [Longimicrobiaceae bacterium]
MSGPFLETVRFELGYYLRRISTWVYFGIFFGIALLLVLAAGGTWDSVGVSFGGSGGNIKVNSPYVLLQITGALSLFGVIVTAALLGNAVYRDYEAVIHPLFFTAPITRFSYLGGRFVGALTVNAVVMLSIPLGLMLGSVLPWTDRARFGAFQAEYFLHPYLVVVLPTLLLTGAVFFALAAFTRQMLPNYIGGVVLVFGYLLAGSLMQDLENERIAAWLDPFGSYAVDLATKYWSPAQRNELLLPLEGIFLWNRLIWVAVGLAVFAAVYARFRFTHVAAERTSRKQAVARDETAGAAYAAPRRLALPEPRRDFGAGAQVRQYATIARQSFWSIVGNRYFYAILAAALLFVAFGAQQVGSLYGTTTWPVTYQVLQVLSGTFTLFLLIIISFYAGEMVWQERDVRMNQVQDATPVPTWVPFAGKLTALALVVTVLQGVVLVAGIATQAAKGYYNFELGLYVRMLFGTQLISLLLLTVFVMLVHVLVNHKYMGHLLVILYVVFSGLMPQFGLEHNLYQYNSGSTGAYSDMNTFGPFMEPFAWFKAYWAAWAALLAVLTNLFWVRGQETRMVWRARLARLRFRRPALAAALVAGVLVVGLGGFIFYNTNVVNEFRTTRSAQEARAEYEKLYKRFEGAPQPRVVGVRVWTDIFPEEARARVRGEYRLRNKTTTPIDSLHLMVPREVEIREMQLDRPATRVLADREHSYYVYRLATPLQPGDSLRLRFDVALGTRGFENEVSNTQVVENGTFFNSALLPSIGYAEGAELGDDDTRRKFGLAPKPRMAPVNDSAARMNTYISRDADWIDFEATVSTSPDQIALAPGYLQREWTEGGRRYFHYRMDSPILNFYSFLSARYVVERDAWRAPDGREVAIEVYHHPGHEYNVERMIYAVKKSLDYFTREFGPYQHRQVRILEFPRYASFAQSFPNTIPYSEGIGFIARLDDEEAVDYPFYVTAHEVAHQWWAHQVIGGDVQGSTLLSETLSQYSAMMVMEKEYGREQMRKFLKYEMNEYFSGRSVERKKEMPLLLVENQQYIHYNKGSVAMYALRDYIGEDRLNAAISKFLEAKRFQEPPYTNSLEFYAYLREATPDSLHYVLTDLFETITMYGNRARSASSRRLPDGRYEVVLEVEGAKVRADSLGNESPVRMNDLVDIGVFAAAPKGKSKEAGPALYMRKHRVASGPQRIRVVVDREPAAAGIDPHHKLLDKHADDNTVAVKAAAGGGRSPAGGS